LSPTPITYDYYICLLPGLITCAYYLDVQPGPITYAYYLDRLPMPITCTYDLTHYLHRCLLFMNFIHSFYLMYLLLVYL